MLKYDTPYKTTVTRFDVPRGSVVYLFKGWDMGLASDDTRIEGIEHVSVTTDPKGGTPSITIPVRYLERFE